MVKIVVWKNDYEKNLPQKKPLDVTHIKATPLEAPRQKPPVTFRATPNLESAYRFARQIH